MSLCMRQLTREWVAKAEGDLHSCLREIRARKHPNYDSACFHAQQCAEKCRDGKDSGHAGASSRRRSPRSPTPPASLSNAAESSNVSVSFSTTLDTSMRSRPGAARIVVSIRIPGSSCSSTSALPLLREIAETQSDVVPAAQKLGLMQVSDSAAIDQAIQAAIDANPKAVADFLQPVTLP